MATERIEIAELLRVVRSVQEVGCVVTPGMLAQWKANRGMRSSFDMGDNGKRNRWVNEAVAELKAHGVTISAGGYL